jgi:predicted dehydrogenase
MGRGGSASSQEDNITLTLRFADGSIGTVHYLPNGNKAFPKERIEVFCGGRVLQLDNFRNLTGWGWPNFKKMNLWKQDKGNKACASAFVSAIKQGGGVPIPFDELLEVARVSFEAVEVATL